MSRIKYNSTLTTKNTKYCINKKPSCIFSYLFVYATIRITMPYKKRQMPIAYIMLVSFIL